jgi:hypothetical protein
MKCLENKYCRMLMYEFLLNDNLSGVLEKFLHQRLYTSKT